MKGIVFRTIKYGDSGLIVDLFTDTHGRTSIMTKISHSRRTSSTAAFFQPLSIIEFEADIRPVQRNLPRPRDVRFSPSYTTIPFSPVKSSIAIFLAEFLCAALREEKENPTLYKYIESSLLWFDEARYPTAIANFHFVFMMHLTHFIGIHPNLDLPHHTTPLCFDLLSGTYSNTLPTHSHYIKKEEALKLPLLFRLKYSTMHLMRLTSQERMRIIQLLNEFYRLHIPNFPELRSTEVLHEVFS